MGSPLEDVGDAVGSAFDFVADNPLALLAAAPVFGPAAVGAAGGANAAAGIGAASADAVLGSGLAMLPSAVPTASILGSSMTPAALEGAFLTPAFASNAVAPAALEAIPGIGMGTDILGSGINMGAMSDAMAPSEIMSAATGGIGATDAMRAAQMMGGGQQQQPVARASGGSGRMPNPKETNLDQLAPQGTGFPEVAPTAGLLDEIIRMGQMRGYV